MGLRHLAFETKDIEKSIHVLNAQGVPTEPLRIDEFTQRKFTFFTDPDGLPLELYEAASEVTCEVATGDDIPGIKILMEATFGPYPKLEEAFTKWMHEGHVVVAKTDGHVIGVSTWCLKLNSNYSQYECFGKIAMQFLTTHNIAWILNLAIQPEYRRRGL